MADHFYNALNPREAEARRKDAAKHILQSRKDEARLAEKLLRIPEFVDWWGRQVLMRKPFGFGFEPTPYELGKRDAIMEINDRLVGLGGDAGKELLADITRRHAEGRQKAFENKQTRLNEEAQ